MCFIKNQEAFEKYLEFLVGRVQAESVVVSTPVQEFYKVLPVCLEPTCPACSQALVLAECSLRCRSTSLCGQSKFTFLSPRHCICTAFLCRGLVGNAIDIPIAQYSSTVI